MNDHPSEWNEPETRYQELEPEPQPQPPHSRQQPPSRRKGGGSGPSRLALALSTLSMILSCVTLFLVLRPEPEEPPAPPEEPVTFRFGDRTLTPLEGMPLNPYDREGFSLDQRGRVAYSHRGKQAKTDRKSVV